MEVTKGLVKGGIVMIEKLKMKLADEQLNYWVVFFGKTLFYLAVMLVLIYFYHFSHIDGGSFIYNEF